MRVVVLILCFAAHVSAACVDCGWQDRDQLNQALPAIFYAYLNHGNDPAMQTFFNEMRSGKLPAAFALRQELIERYQGAEIIPGFDAKKLFVLSATDPSSVPSETTKAMYLSIYDEIRQMFALSLALRHQFGIFPAREYSRPLEIVRRMSAPPDPYLKALNTYYQGLLLLNQGLDGMSMISDARCEFESYLDQTIEKSWQKRILLQMAEADLILGNEREAEGYYLWVLKIDPNDWDGLINLSYLLREQGVCSDPGIWVEASIKSTWAYYEVVIHCGNIEIPDDPTGPPFTADAEFSSSSTG